ncbi:unnamed protein product [Oikopleura dioica]|uniref:General transcription and DNA repair factor IIH subunit TFB5 n=1 Tax=Oikopleura dioica TaxID=34765 RepID=E4WRP0_OIKDI|nr:unnamed protein product [Oikopleura dioica]
MVNVENGKLVTCDPALKQFLLNLDEKREFGGRRFILKDLDETHLFVTADCDTWLKGRLADLMTENSFPIGEHV